MEIYELVSGMALGIPDAFDGSFQVLLDSIHLISPGLLYSDAQENSPADSMNQTYFSMIEAALIWASELFAMYRAVVWRFVWPMSWAMTA